MTNAPVSSVVSVPSVGDALPSGEPLPVPAGALARLEAVYAQLDAELEPVRRNCRMRGACCNFAASGNMLYVTALEALHMARSGLAADETQAGDGMCPFLRGRSCGARAHRALGCRLHYCDRTYEEERNALYEKFLKLIRRIEAEHGIQEAYRPVTRIAFRT